MGCCFCGSPLRPHSLCQRLAFLLPCTPVEYTGVLASLVGVIPVVNVPVDLVPDALALYFRAVVEVECSSCEVAEPQDVGVLLVAVVLVSCRPGLRLRGSVCLRPTTLEPVP